MASTYISIGHAINVGSGWRDLLVPGSSAGQGSAAPTFGNLTGNLSFWRGYKFSATAMNDLHVLWHINHDYMPGSDITFHVHWVPSDNNTGNVIWGFQYSYARCYNVEAFPASTTVTITSPAPGTVNKHQISETPGFTIPNLEPDGIILARMFRDGANAADTYPSVVNVLTIDLHYQCDRITTTNRNRGNGWYP